METDVKSWSPDFIFKLAVLRESKEPGPMVLDWAAQLTWLVMCQQKIDKGEIDMEVYIYSACAIKLCEKLCPIKGTARSSWLELGLNFSNIEGEWKRRALARCLFYVKTRYPVLSNQRLKHLKLIAKREHDRFFAIAEQYGAEVRSQLSDWGVQL